MASVTLKIPRIRPLIRWMDRRNAEALHLAGRSRRPGRATHRFRTDCCHGVRTGSPEPVIRSSPTSHATHGSPGGSPDLLRDRDTAEATYEVVRGVAGGIALVFTAFTLYHLTADPGAAAGLVIALDQVVLIASVLAFWLMLRRKIPIDWAHSVAVTFGLLVAANTASSVIVQGEGSDLQYMQAIVIAAGAIVLSNRAFALILLGTAAMALPAAAIVCSRDQLLRFRRSCRRPPLCSASPSTTLGCAAKKSY